MEIILDTANIADIKKYNELVNIKGVTTNPTIITNSKKPFIQVINEIIEVLDDEQDLYVQVISTNYEDMLKEAIYISKLRKSTDHMYVKVPVSKEGLKLIKTLSTMKIKTLATAIYSANQGFIAAINGASALAPYVNRMCNYGDGIKNVIDLQTMLDINGMDTKIVAASFKNANQAHELIVGGIKALTLPTDVLEAMLGHDATNTAINKFSTDWEEAYGIKTLIQE